MPCTDQYARPLPRFLSSTVFAPGCNWAAATSIARSAPDAASAALYATAILWDLGFDTIYAHQDREDDALLGIGSSALVLGEQTKPFLAAAYAGASGQITSARDPRILQLGGKFYF